MSSTGSSSSIAEDTSSTKETTRPIWKRRPSGSSRRSARTRAGRRRSRTSWNGSGSSPKARQAKSKARIKAFDQLVEAQEKRASGKAQIVIQVPERLGGKVIEVKGLTKAYGDKLLFEDLSFNAAAGRDRRRDRPQRRRQDHPVQADHRPGTARRRRGRRSADTVHLGYVDQSRDALDPKHNVWEEISGGHRDHDARQA